MRLDPGFRRESADLSCQRPKGGSGTYGVALGARAGVGPPLKKQGRNDSWRMQNEA